MKLEETGERKTSLSPYFFIKVKWTPVSHIPRITVELKFNQANVFRETESDHDEVFKFVLVTKHSDKTCLEKNNYQKSLTVQPYWKGE